MPRLDLSSCLTKLEWAELHVESLKREISVWANANGERPVIFEPEFHRRSGFVKLRVKRVRSPWASLGMILGDALNNYRAALDHLAWELVAKGRNPNPKNAARVQFPVVQSSRKEFIREVAPDRLPGVGTTRLNKVSVFQPYESRGLGHPSYALVRLAELTRQDKHRELLPTILQPYGYRIRSITPGVVVRVAELRQQPGDPFEPDMEILRVYLRPKPWPVPRPSVDVNFDEAAQICIEDIPVMDALAWIDEYVGEVLASFVGQ